MPRPGRWDDAKIVSIKRGGNHEDPCWIVSIRGTDCTRTVYLYNQPDEMGAYAAALRILTAVRANTAAPTKDIEQ